MGFPARQYIDDQCDGCGKKDLPGVAWGYQKPVLCIECIALGSVLLSEPGYAADDDRSGPTGKTSSTRGKN